MVVETLSGYGGKAIVDSNRRGTSCSGKNLCRSDERRLTRQSITSDTQTKLITVMTHEGQRMDLDAAYGYEIKENEDGLLGILGK